jgi:hypothetical protein
MLLTQNIPGPIVECGCFKGAMTAKMSIICNELGKELYVFDSFKGLPHDEPYYHTPYAGTQRFKGEFVWRKGQFSASKKEVEDNVLKYGEIDVCTFVEGFFEDTLHEYELKPSMVFIDVDLTTSMKTCVKHWWPRLVGPRFYSHEAQIAGYSEALIDKQWWNVTMDCEPPPHVGCGTGFIDAPALCFLQKIHPI